MTHDSSSGASQLDPQLSIAPVFDVFVIMHTDSPCRFVIFFSEYETPKDMPQNYTELQQEADDVKNAEENIERRLKDYERLSCSPHTRQLGTY